MSYNQQGFGVWFGATSLSLPYWLKEVTYGHTEVWVGNGCPSPSCLTHLPEAQTLQPLLSLVCKLISRPLGLEDQSPT